MSFRLSKTHSSLKHTHTTLKRISKPPRPSRSPRTPHRPKPSRFTRLAVSHILTRLHSPLSTLSSTSLRQIIHEQMDELLELKREVEMEEVTKGINNLRTEIVDSLVEGLSEVMLDEEEDDGGVVEKYEDTMSGAAETEWSSDLEDDVDAAFFPVPDDDDEEEEEKSDSEDEEDSDGDAPTPDDEQEQHLPDI